VDKTPPITRRRGRISSLDADHPPARLVPDTGARRLMDTRAVVTERRSGTASADLPVPPNIPLTDPTRLA
jgi:hypothetical protein